MKHNANLIDCVKVYNMVVTLRAMVDYMDAAVMEEEHPLKKEFIHSLKESCGDFGKLEQMMEECIDLGRARQNEYIINPNFSDKLKELHVAIQAVRKKMDSTKAQVEDDFNISKNINLVESNMYGFVFEVDKKEGDNAMRKSKNTYKILTVKNRIMTFTCNALREQVREF